MCACRALWLQVGVLEHVLGSIRASLDKAGTRAQLIVSGHGEWRFLDIVPAQAGKLPALEYVQRHWGFGPHNTVACGDSGNDIDMLAGANLAIVVGNAQPDLATWVAALPDSANPELRINDRTCRRLRVSPQNRAHGILEGLQYFGFR